MSRLGDIMSDEGEDEEFTEDDGSKKDVEVGEAKVGVEGTT